MSDPLPFAVVRCNCGSMLLDGHFTGIVRAKCHGCGQRVWVGSDGTETKIVASDPPNRRIMSGKDL